METWKVKEFKDICHNLGLTEACLYADSLSIIWLYAKYRRSIIQKNLDEMKDPKSFFKNMAWHSFIIDCELNSLMLYLNSIFDILGQLINECFITPKIPIDCITFDKVIKHSSIPDNLKPILNSIKGNTLYQKIRAYANVSKHRYVIQGTNNIDFTKTPSIVSYKSKEFEYKGKWLKFTHDTAFRCWKFVGESLVRVGNTIQGLLKAQVVN